MGPVERDHKAGIASADSRSFDIAEGAQSLDLVRGEVSGFLVWISLEQTVSCDELEEFVMHLAP